MPATMTYGLHANNCHLHAQDLHLLSRACDYKWHVTYSMCTFTGCKVHEGHHLAAVHETAT